MTKTEWLERYVVVGSVRVSLVQASTTIDRYLTDSTALFAYPHYDRLHTNDDYDAICDGDLLAPTLLNAPPSIAAFAGLNRQRSRLEAALAPIPQDLHLSNADPSQVGLLGRLYDVLDDPGIPGVRGSTLAKVLHRKRPAFIPLYDERIRRCYQDGPNAPVPPRSGRSWAQLMVELATAIQTDLRSDGDSWDRLDTVIDGRVTRLRALDIVAWTFGLPVSIDKRTTGGQSFS